MNNRDKWKVTSLSIDDIDRHNLSSFLKINEELSGSSQKNLQ